MKGAYSFSRGPYNSQVQKVESRITKPLKSSHIRKSGNASCEVTAIIASIDRHSTTQVLTAGRPISLGKIQLNSCIFRSKTQTPSLHQPPWQTTSQGPTHWNEMAIEEVLPNPQRYHHWPLRLSIREQLQVRRPTLRCRSERQGQVRNWINVAPGSPNWSVRQESIFRMSAISLLKKIPTSCKLARQRQPSWFSSLLCSVPRSS